MSEKNPYNRCSESVVAFSEASKFLVGAVNSPVRAFGGLDVSPVFIAGAKGSKIYDVDGNEYIDYVCSWGAQILGHSHPEVLKAVENAARKGTTFGAPTQQETLLAKKIVDAFSSIDKVRLVSSGTEAVMSAVRLARAYTGRDLLIKMAGCYHGHSDSLLVSAGSGLAEASKPSSAGVPESLVRLTIVVPYNDIDSVERVFEINKGKVAAVIVEPVAANMGVIPPVDGYLKGLRDLCDNNGAVLIFDEVITGFRVAYGGAQQLYGVNADITCLGKIVGGGLPAAAFGGRAEIMDLLAPLGPVYQAGTLSGNPVAVAAANTTIELLRRPDTYKKLDALGKKLQKGLKQAAEDVGIEVSINRVGSLMSCFFTTNPVRNFEVVRTTNISRFKRFFAEMLKQSIYLAPSAYEAMFISLAHSEQDIERTIEAGENSFRLIIDI
jgi:glutamate-1-semialdehyde 2,1-aminomutase